VGILSKAFKETGENNNAGYQEMKGAFVAQSLLLFLLCVESSQAQPSTTSAAPRSELAWVTPEVNAQRVSFHTFFSDAVKGKVSYHLYTPNAYDRETDRRFPVVYWLHGSGGGLAGIAKVAAHFDAAIEAGKTPPCLVVFVNGLAGGMYVDWKDGSVPMETIVVQELLPHIDATYRTIAARGGRLLDGYSMGGYGAARLGFKYTDLFSAVSIMGGGPLQAELIQTPRVGRQRASEVLKQVYGGDQEYFKSVSPRRLAEQNAEAIIEGSLVRQVCGDQDETLGPNRDFHELLESLKIPHAWIVLTGVDHNPMKTLEALGDSNWLFYRAAFDGPSLANRSEHSTIAMKPNSVKSAETINSEIEDQDRRVIVVNAFTPTEDNCKAAAQYSHSQQGTGVLVMVRGEILFEDYAPGWNANKPHLLASGTKSFCGVMAACAVEDDLIALDEKVADTLTEWKEDEFKSQITIRQMLSLCSGVDGGPNGSVPSYKQAVAMAKASAKPGKKFSYGPIPFQCFGELMRRKLEPKQESVEAYLHRRVLDPIGLKVAFWRKDSDGNINLPSGAFLTPREWVKFGELVRLGGKWNGTEIVSANILQECFKPSTAQPAYGMTWWLLGDGDETSTEAANGGIIRSPAKRLMDQRRKRNFAPPADTVAAMGKGKNRCYVIPSLEMVVIRMGDSEGREFSDNEFLARVLATDSAKAKESLTQ
jgi:CubicO group peptidase (beta-lactamase class C family)/enterochelin esterase-like enzyme